MIYGEPLQGILQGNGKPLGTPQGGEACFPGGILQEDPSAGSPWESPPGFPPARPQGEPPRCFPQVGPQGVPTGKLENIFAFQHDSEDPFLGPFLGIGASGRFGICFRFRHWQHADVEKADQGASATWEQGVWFWFPVLLLLSGEASET